jgi:hypothetical protein
VRPPGDETAGAELEVLVDDQSRFRKPIPTRRGPSGDSPEILVPLPATESGSVTVKIIQRPADAKTLVEWHILETIEIAPTVAQAASL